MTTVDLPVREPALKRTRERPRHRGERVTLLVVTYNSAPLLDALFTSLHAGLDGLPDWQLIVVDNDSSDGTPEAVARLRPGTRVIRMGRNAGYAAAINAAMDAARPDDTVVVMNPDLSLHRGCVRELIQTLAQPGVGVAFPRLLGTDGLTSPSIRREPSVGRVWADALLGGGRAARWGLSQSVGDTWSYEVAHDVEWATGALLAISPECRLAVGRWDESFFLYSEEVDYCRRARKAGFRLRYVPTAVATHDGGPYGGNVELWRLLVRNRAVDYQRHHGPMASAMFRAGLAGGELLRAPMGRAHRAGVRAALTGGDPAPAPDRTRDVGRPDVIWFAAQDWWYHNQAHSDFQLMREVARTRKVLVVNSLGLRLPRKGTSTRPMRRILRKARSTAKLVRRPVPDLPGFHVMTPVILPMYGDTVGARVNSWLIRQQVRTVAKLVGIQGPPDVGVTIPTAWPVVSRMSRASTLLNRSDLQSAFPEADGAWVTGLEERLLANSDRVLYVSHELMAQDRELVGDRGVFLDHGVDLAHFTPDGPVAPEIDRIPGPRIGFFGGLDDYVVDMDLLLQTALAIPDASLVLVGDATVDMDDLTRLPNVHWLGYRPYAEIPALGRGFDVALMPWLDNEWIRFANPIKLKEYLALGLPVVSTEYPEVDRYRQLIRVAGSKDAFLAQVRAALRDPGDPDERRTAVLGSSWRLRAAVLNQVTDQVRSRTCAG